MIAIAGLLYAYMMWENKRRDRAAGRRGSVEVVYKHGKDGSQADARAVEDGFRDFTDRQGKYFRYAL